MKTSLDMAISGLAHLSIRLLLCQPGQRSSKPPEMASCEEEETRLIVYFSHLPFTISLHQLAERSVPFDFELHHRAILASHLQVDVLAVLRLHSLLQRNKEAKAGMSDGVR